MERRCGILEDLLSLNIRPNETTAVEQDLAQRREWSRETSRPTIQLVVS